MSIQCWDSNPQPSEHESPPITTRPGLLLSKKSKVEVIGIWMAIGGES